MASVCALAALTGCATMPVGPPLPPPPPVPAPLLPVDTLVRAEPETVGFHAALNVTLDSIMEAAIAAGVAPGAALAVGRYGRLVHLRGYGRADWAETARRVDEQTIWDLASLTKVVGTTTAAMVLEEGGFLDLDRAVVEYLPEFDDPAKERITIRMLLTHRGGLEAYAPLYREHRGRDEYLEQINERPLAHPPGTETVYSDWDMVLLQLVIERITGRTLDDILEGQVFGPLGMEHTLFNPPASLRDRIAATEVSAARGGQIWGEVHDSNAWALGGVAGHAGLFSTARDLAVFAQMMLNGGKYGRVRLLEPATIVRWSAPQWSGSSRALGWDTPSGESSAGHFFSPYSFGHTGYTGTSMWIDPARGVFVILLTNRVNPTAENSLHVPLRRAIADAVQSAILNAPLIDWEQARR